jgi:hypothetical protein
MAVQSCKMSQKILHYTHYMGPMNHTMSEPDDGPDRPRLLPLSPLWIIEKQVCELRARVRIRKPRATGNCERPAMASLAPSLHFPWYASSSPLLHLPSNISLSPPRIRALGQTFPIFFPAPFPGAYDLL